MELSDVLSDKPVAPPAPVEPAAPAVEATPEPASPAATEARDRAPNGQFAPKVDAPAPAPVVAPVAPVTPPRVELSEKERAFLRTAQEERAKRQALETEIAQLRAVPKEPPKPFWDDPEGALKRQQEEFEQSKNQIQQLFTQERMKTSEYHARKTYPDFDAKVDEFGKALQEVPGLYQQWVASPDPADFAYQTAKNRIELREVGSIEQFRAKIEKEAEIKAEAKWKKHLEDLEKQRAAIPPTLTDAPGSPGANKPVWGGPPPLSEILAR